MSARTAWPKMRPVSPSSPVGRSQATTGQDRLFSRRTAARKARCTGRLRPTPNRASMAQSHRLSQADCSGSSGSNSSIFPPRSRRRRAISRASAVILAQSPTKMVRTQTPRSISSLAAASPSPPLFPGPQNTAAQGAQSRSRRCKRARTASGGSADPPEQKAAGANSFSRRRSARSSSAASATARAARSIRSREGTPRSSMAMWSSRRHCWGVSRGCIRSPR